MKIGIDCRIYGPKHTGIGRYVQNLVEQLMAVDEKNEYILFVREDFLTQNTKFKTVVTDINHYSLKEQLLFPSIIKREKLDLMHFPHFNVPMFYRGKYIVTIHDLIKHLSKGAATTTRSATLYWLKYLGYKLVFKQAIKRAEKIIAPSQFVKDQLVRRYHLNSDKVVVTYEGVDEKFQINTKYKILNTKYKISKPYLLYVGSVYPHKNLERLIEAVKSLQHTGRSLQLIIVCARNVFSERLNNFIDQNKAGDFVKFTGYVPDEELACLYRDAKAFVFPTLSEGVGLPGLEAMSLGCPVLCSDIPVLKEIYKDSAIYFDPLNPFDITEKIKNFMSNKSLQDKLSQSGLKLAQTYSWTKMAKETLSIYQFVAR